MRRLTAWGLEDWFLVLVEGTKRVLLNEQHKETCIVSNRTLRFKKSAFLGIVMGFKHIRIEVDGRSEDG